MKWLLPGPEVIPRGGVIRCIGKFDRRAYDRAYYHANRKGHVKQAYTEAQKARRRDQRMQQYRAALERARANGRASYWRALAKKERAI
jgi:hypothetical protein